MAGNLGATVPAGFPAALLPLVRCPVDGGELRPSASANEDYIVTGSVACVCCRHEYPVRNGVLDLLGDESPTDRSSAHEMVVRDTTSPIERGTPSFKNSWADDAEFVATTNALGDLRGKTVLEIGCGSGFYTRFLERAATAVICVDFSRLGLERNAAAASPSGALGFVRAEVTTLRLAPTSFNLALNTLYSNLASADLRRACNATVFDSLRLGGRYIVSAHHHHLRARLKRWPMAGTYEANGVFFESLLQASLRDELNGFDVQRVRPIVPQLPMTMRLRSDRNRGRVARLAERAPLVRQYGLLLIGEAQRPVHVDTDL